MCILPNIFPLHYYINLIGNNPHFAIYYRFIDFGSEIEQKVVDFATYLLQILQNY